MSAAGPVGWRAALRDLSLLLCAALAGYLVSVVLAARLGRWLVAALSGEHSAAARLALGTLVLDFSKAPALLLLAWGLGRVLSLGPGRAALALLGLSYGLELLTDLALGSMVFRWPVLLSRLGAAAVLFVAVRWVLGRGARHRRTRSAV